MGRADFLGSAHICIIQEFLGMSIRPAQNKLVLQIASDQTLFKIDFKLGVDLPPVLPVSGPFFRDIHSCQIQHFQKAVIRRENRFAFSHFPELTIESFNGICGVNQASYCLRIFEISGQGCPVIMPGFIDFWVLGIPFILEQF